MAEFKVNFSSDDQMQVDFESEDELRMNFDNDIEELRMLFGETTPIATDDYNLLRNHPRIESVELVGDKSFAQLGLTTVKNSEIEAIFN